MNTSMATTPPASAPATRPAGPRWSRSYSSKVASNSESVILDPCTPHSPSRNAAPCSSFFVHLPRSDRPIADQIRRSETWRPTIALTHRDRDRDQSSDHLRAVLYGLSTVLLVLALRHGDLSMIYPVIALTFVWVTLLSVMVIGEPMTPSKLSGIATIVAGVSILGLGPHRDHTAGFDRLGFRGSFRGQLWRGAAEGRSRGAFLPSRSRARPTGDWRQAS